MLQNQLARGNNGLIKTKYLTFSIEADSIRSAKPRLERIETDVLNNFKRLGVAPRFWTAKPGWPSFTPSSTWTSRRPSSSSGTGWLPAAFPPRTLSRRPASSSVPASSSAWERSTGAVSFVQILAPELNDRMLADFLDMESSLIVNLHIQSVDQVKAIKTVKRKITDLDRSKIEEQKKAVRAGYDMDISATRS